LVKQYTKIFEFENVKLKFQEDALWAVAKEATNRKSGARGLRAILEDVMLDIMYDIPSQENVKECVVSKDVILKREKPLILYENKTKSA
jgi:ATP-dependent Clp protease ATP-binding subunit ClpX